MKEPSYSRLCKEHREVIYRMNEAGNSQSVIADAIGFRAPLKKADFGPIVDGLHFFRVLVA